jgi:carbohydrate kinase (thermoresistant glucokinase family)
MSTQHVAVMGVSGSGKSTVGELIATRLGATFIDGDLLHPKANVAKMESGTPLNDEDRKPWLEMIGHRFADADGHSLVIACSALKRAYRDIIRAAAPGVRFVLLHGPAELLAERLEHRRGHFMPSSLLASQLATLEPLEGDEAGFTLDIRQLPDELARQAVARLMEF